jgi:NADPH:quinone reductase-like Zn-dependent oxidoreductase
VNHHHIWRQAAASRSPPGHLIRSLCTGHLVDYTTTDFARSGRRYDLTLDTAGNRTAPDLRRALAEGGKAGITR